MSIGGTASIALHLFIVSSCFNDWSANSLEMSDFLFERKTGHSSLDLVKEFFNRTLLPSCDATANACDADCCSDQDCSAWDVDAFDCRTEPFPRDLATASPLSCYGVHPAQRVHPMLCYELDNSPYLGSFFPESVAMKREEVESTGRLVNSWLARVEQPAEGSRLRYTHGVTLRLQSGVSLTIPGSLLGNGYCSLHTPVRYLVDTISACTSNIDAETCGISEKFNLASHVRVDSFGSLFPPDIYSGNNSFKIVNVAATCTKETGDISDSYAECNIHQQRATYDSLSSVCRNVVTQIEYRFHWHENYLTSAQILLVLSNVSTAKRPSIVPSDKFRRSQVTQTINVLYLKI